MSHARSRRLFGWPAAAVALCSVVACSGGGGGAGNPTTSPVVSGQLDSAFGVNGRATMASGAGIEVLADGGVLVAGDGITKLNAVGTPIATFAQSIGYRFPVLDAAGNVYVNTSAPAGPSIAKLDAAGQRVASFGVDGLATLPYGSDGAFDVAALVRDTAGNLFLVGTKRSALSSSAMVVKFDPDGRRVDSFGSAGVRVIEPGGRLATGLGAAVNSQGHLFVAGWTAFADDLALSMFVAKLDVDGRASTDFGAGAPEGFWLSPNCSTHPSPARSYIGTESAVALAVDAAGGVLVGGRCQPQGSNSRPVIFRLDSRGTTDPAFRESGLRPDLFGPSVPDESEGSTVAVIRPRPGGVIYAGGTRRNSAVICGDFALAKLSASGDAVRTFGMDGVAIFDVAGDAVSDIAFDGLGRLYAAGASFGGCPTGRPFGLSFTVFRLGS